MEAYLAAAIDPLRRFADFHGRSTRTELLCFFALLSAVHLAFRMLLPMQASDWVITAAEALTLVPSIALATRRLHDVGWSGLWLLPLAPIIAFNAWQAFSFFNDPVAPLPEPPMPAFLVGFAYAICLTPLLLWDDDPDTNRFGPNPRLAD